MADIAPLATFHYVMGSIKGKNVDKNLYGRPCVGIRQTGFEDGNEIETETDEGHTGVSNLDMGSYRTTAESSPQWEDKFRYGEWLEETFYLLLGTVNPNGQGESVTTGKEDNTHAGVFSTTSLCRLTLKRTCLLQQSIMDLLKQKQMQEYSITQCLMN